ncbi:MAG: hypothetical protein FWG36_08075 [Oscillospiraceae bacterium]|nr:hypothetical protein [Oscillospiraceae bacterium]
MTEGMQTSAIMTAGMRILRETLGIIETEVFIANIKRESFNYTEWRRGNLFENMTLDELVSKASEFELRHPELIPRNAKII